MQALRFISEGWNDSQYPNVGEGLRNLLGHGSFNCLYFQSDCRLGPDESEIYSNLTCDTTVIDIWLRGRRWTSARSCQHGLPQTPLTYMQAGELGDAYKEQGDFTLQLSRAISYFDGVTYKIQGVDISDEEGG